MNRSPAPLPEPEVIDGLNANRQLAFATLYDRYAALLLGVITKIVSDRTEATGLLQVAFSTIHVQMDKLQTGKQPLFLQVLQIARHTALDALRQRQPAKTVTLHLTETGKILSPNWQQVSTILTDSRTNPLNPQQNELLDSILFKNCTHEEAAISMGIPVETVRQQLRLAIQQLRTTSRC